MKEKNNLIRQKNLDRLKRFLFEHKTALKAEMAKETAMSVVTINSLVKQLVEEGSFLEGEAIQQTLGRPAIEYSFNYDKHHYLLLSVQEKMTVEIKRKLTVVGKIVNLAGTEKLTHTIDFPEPSTALLITIIQQFLDFGLPIKKIGLSIPGKIHNQLIVSSWADVFDGWNIEQELKKITDVPIAIQNDAHLMTIGFSIAHQLLENNTVVGIFYPEKSMPGITIWANGALIEGNQKLAGEAKFLPMLMDSGVPQSNQELSDNLSDILALYNAVIAPAAFVISSETVPEILMRETIDRNVQLKRQPNTPVLYFAQDFQQAVTAGLRWLVSKQTLYEIIE